MNLLVNQQIDRNQWEELMAASPWANPFQSTAFYDFFNSAPGLSAEVAAIEEGGELLALAVFALQKEPGVKGFFSRRAIVYGGPLLREGAHDALLALLQAADKQLSRRAIYLEVRNYHDYDTFKPVFKAAGWDYKPHLNIQVSLEGKDPDSLLKEMSYNRRREIRLTLKAGLIYEPCQNEEDLQQLYQILLELYQTRVKLPLPEYNFFKTLYQSEVSKVFVVKDKEQVAGGSICIELPGKSIYTMYYCGLRDYGSKIFPTHLAVWAAMEYGLEQNMELFDFMGAGTPDVDYGVRKYKSKFGGEQVEHGRFHKVTQPVLFSVGKLGLQLMTKLK